MPLSPLSDHVLFRRSEVSTTPGGLILTNNRSDEGTVVAVGPGYLMSGTGLWIPTGIKAGDTVLIKPGHGVQVTVDGEKLWMCQSNEIFGIVTKVN